MTKTSKSLNSCSNGSKLSSSSMLKSVRSSRTMGDLSVALVGRRRRGPPRREGPADEVLDGLVRLPAAVLVAASTEVLIRAQYGGAAAGPVLQQCGGLAQPHDRLLDPLALARVRLALDLGPP